MFGSSSVKIMLASGIPYSFPLSSLLLGCILNPAATSISPSNAFLSVLWVGRARG